MDTPNQPFWRTKTLEEMTREEWESLCDACAKCCLYKFQNEATGQLFYTEVACKLLDMGKCRCTHYEDRRELMPTCLVLTPTLVRQLDWLPETCAYRLVKEGQDLPWWHPLKTGSRDMVHRMGVSIRGRAISETEIGDDDLEDHIVDWIE
jgi:uncharacterized cysteine cluster protein YcgN (CxxCxxCC family)